MRDYNNNKEQKKKEKEKKGEKEKKKNKNNKKKRRRKKKNLVCQLHNIAVTTGSIFFPTELNLGALNQPITLILCSYITSPHISLMGMVMLL